MTIYSRVLRGRFVSVLGRHSWQRLAPYRDGSIDVKSKQIKGENAQKKRNFYCPGNQMPDGGNPFFVISETNKPLCSEKVENTDWLSGGREYRSTIHYYYPKNQMATVNASSEECIWKHKIIPKKITFYLIKEVINGNWNAFSEKDIFDVEENL